MDDNLGSDLVEDGLNIAFGGYIASMIRNIGISIAVNFLRSKTEILVVASKSIN